MLWLEGTEATATGTAPQFATLLNSLNAQALALRPFTVVRTRGLLVARSDQEAASEYFSIAYGMIVVSDQAVTAGIASVPSPDLESSSDWHVYDRLGADFLLGDATGFGLISVSREIDSKAMRKVDIGEDLIAVQEVSSASDGGVILSSFVRVLVKLH